MNEKLWNPTEELLREPAAPAGREGLIVKGAQLVGVTGKTKLFSCLFANKLRLPIQSSASNAPTVSLKHIHLRQYWPIAKAASVVI